MGEIFTKLSVYLTYSFVQYALIAGVLIALCSSLLGVTLVLKRFSFIGDGLSHVAFGAMAIAADVNITLVTIIIVIDVVVDFLRGIYKNIRVTVRHIKASAVNAVCVLVERKPRVVLPT